MVERSATVGSSVGLHARPAALLAKAAAAAPVEVSIRKGDAGAVAAKSVLGLMTLGAEHGDKVILQAQGAEADETLARLAELIEAADG